MEDSMRDGGGIGGGGELWRPLGLNLVTGSALGLLEDLWAVARERARALADIAWVDSESAMVVEGLVKALAEFEGAAAVTWKYSGHLNEDAAGADLRSVGLLTWLDTLTRLHITPQLLDRVDRLNEFRDRAIEYLCCDDQVDDGTAQKLLEAAIRAFDPFADPDSAEVALAWLAIGLRRRVRQELPFLAHEFATAGRDDLALELYDPHSIEERLPTVPNGFADIVRLGMSLGLSRASQAKRAWDGLEQIMLTQPVIITGAAAAPPDLVWRALTMEAELWDLPHDTSTGQVIIHGVKAGASVERWAQFPLSGTVTEACPFERITWEWAPCDSPAYTSVTVRLRPVEGGTLIRIEESGCPSEQFFDISLAGSGRSDARHRPWGSGQGRPEDRVTFWTEWLTNLNHWLVGPSNHLSDVVPHQAEVDGLWTPLDPKATEEKVLQYRDLGARWRVRPAHTPSDPPWYATWAGEVQLELLHARALSAQGRLEDAERTLHVALAGFVEAPRWAPMLHSLELARTARQRAISMEAEDPLQDTDGIWGEAAEHYRRCIELSRHTNLDIALQATYEIGNLKTTGDHCPPTSMWLDYGLALARRARTPIRDKWSPRFQRDHSLL